MQKKYSPYIAVTIVATLLLTAYILLLVYTYLKNRKNYQLAKDLQTQLEKQKLARRNGKSGFGMQFEDCKGRNEYSLDHMDEDFRITPGFEDIAHFLFENDEGRNSLIEQIKIKREQDKSGLDLMIAKTAPTEKVVLTESAKLFKEIEEALSDASTDDQESKDWAPYDIDKDFKKRILVAYFGKDAAN